MKVLIWSILVFGSAFLVHWGVWRIRLPRRQIKALLGIFFLVLGVWLLLFAAVPGLSLAGFPVPEKGAERAHLVLFFISFTLAYMITYSALEADSPSLVMVLEVAARDGEGLPKDSLERLMNDDRLIQPRMNDLVLDRMAVREGDTYRLTPKGRMFARLFRRYRTLMGAEGKGG